MIRGEQCSYPCWPASANRRCPATLTGHQFARHLSPHRSTAHSHSGGLISCSDVLCLGSVRPPVAGSREHLTGPNLNGKSGPMRVDTPLTESLTEELFEFWIDIFGVDPDVTREALLGDELEHNRDALYLERQGDRLAGTCLVTTSDRLPILGGVGEVATAPEFRRSGMATRLCAQAVEEFRANGGEAVFLGSGIPAADRIYERLGWRKLAGANVSANITNGDSPEAFLVDYFRDQGEASVWPATPEDRIPMVPLLHVPHDWRVLDANARMYSTRYCVQRRCMGLFGMYRAVVRDGRGAWFAARTSRGRTVGMSTARLDDAGGCQVDGFAHRYYLELLDDLIRTAMDWGTARGAALCWAVIATLDEEKRALFEALGFRETGPADEFDLDGVKVGAMRLERA